MMRSRFRLVAVIMALATALVAASCGGTGGGGSSDENSVTVYTADGLSDWYGKRFEQFTARTGIKVQIVEAGSGEVVSRLDKERSNPQADVLVTLPPFVQRAAQQDLLASNHVPGTESVPAALKDPQGRYTAMMNNYLDFVHNPDSGPPPVTWNDLLAPRFRGKLQYSTPGQAGDGTAVLLQLQHVFGKRGALDYLRKLEANNVGPSSSTGKLEQQVTKGELHVANGDTQMNLASIENENARFRVFFPAGPDGKPSTFSLPYYAGLAKGAPHDANGRKLLEFLFSPESQSTMPSVYGQPTRTDVRPDDPAARRLEDTLRGVDIWQPDWDAVLASYERDLADYKEAVGR